MNKNFRPLSQTIVVDHCRRPLSQTIVVDHCRRAENLISPESARCPLSESAGAPQVRKCQDMSDCQESVGTMAVSVPALGGMSSLFSFFVLLLKITVQRTKKRTKDIIFYPFSLYYSVLLHNYCFKSTRKYRYSQNIDYRHVSSHLGVISDYF